MSLWRITKYEPLLEREWTVVALLPDELSDGALPIEMLLLAADPGCEADALPRRYPLERALCRERGVAALCVPGWAAECPQADALFSAALPGWLEAMFPVRVDARVRTGGSACFSRYYSASPDRSGVTEPL